MFQQLSDAMCKRIHKDHVKRTSAHFPLREVVVILDQRSRETHPQLDTTGKVLKIKKLAVTNNFST